jgi:hypothetical protein
MLRLWRKLIRELAGCRLLSPGRASLAGGTVTCGYVVALQGAFGPGGRCARRPAAAAQPPRNASAGTFISRAALCHGLTATSGTPLRSGCMLNTPTTQEPSSEG